MQNSGDNLHFKMHNSGDMNFDFARQNHTYS